MVTVIEVVPVALGMIIGEKGGRFCGSVAVRGAVRSGVRIFPEPHLNRTGPQWGSGCSQRARTAPGSGSGFGKSGLRTGPHRTAATLIKVVIDKVVLIGTQDT